MNKRNKKDLYESIMSNVAKQVKKALNEARKPVFDAAAWAKKTGFDIVMQKVIIDECNGDWDEFVNMPEDDRDFICSETFKEDLPKSAKRGCEYEDVEDYVLRFWESFTPEMMDERDLAERWAQFTKWRSIQDETADCEAWNDMGAIDREDLIKDAYYALPRYLRIFSEDELFDIVYDNL